MFKLYPNQIVCKRPNICNMCSCYYRHDKQQTFYSLLGLRLHGQLLDVDLSTQATVSSDSLVVAGQLFEGLEVLAGEGVGADGSEGSGRAGAGGEELLYALV